MSDSTSGFGFPDTIDTSDAQKEVIANEYFKATSPADLYANRYATTTGLTWGYYGGRFDSTSIADGTLLLTASSTNYVVALLSNGTISTSTVITNWNDTTNYLRLYQVVTGGSTITSYTDYRWLVGASGGGGGGGGVTSVALTVPGIFSVAGSPITTSGTLAVTLATQAANILFAGPTTGGAAVPTFRSMVAADIPNTAVTPGSYTTADITVDAQGRITLAANGSGGSGLTHFTESVTTAAPNATVPVVRLLATNAAASVDVALSPKLDGALTAQVADNTTTGGNKRGLRAVDWQMTRTTNTDVASGTYSAIGGGADNRATATAGAIAGGTVNRITHNYGSIGGGNTNAVSQPNGTIAGGLTNTVSATSAAIGGGTSNTASGADSAIPGGSNNAASGANSICLGGSNNIANSQYGVASGSRASNKTMIGAMTHASGQFNVDGDAQTNLLVIRGATTNATPKVLTTNAGAAASTNQVRLEDDSAYLVDVRLVARSSADQAAYQITNVLIYRGTGVASTTVQGTPTVTTLQNSAGASAWVVTATADTTNGCLSITVTGVAATNIKWVATCRTVEVAN